MNISIIISIFKNEEFIEECITSILNAGKNHNIEILLGVDGDNETEEFIKNNQFIQDNCKCYYFQEGKHPYTVKNYLVTIAQYEWLSFFDADDIMHSDYYNIIEKNINTKDKLYRVQYKELNSNKKNNAAEGVFFIDKNIFLNLNGFRDFCCGADTEFKLRYNKHVNLQKITNALFYRRIHPNSLTQKEETGRKSELRLKVIKEIKRLAKKNYPNPDKLYISTLKKNE